MQNEENQTVFGTSTLARKPKKGFKLRKGLNGRSEYEPEQK